MKNTSKEHQGRYFSCERIIAFSDGVFSIAMTLCLLETLPADLSSRILNEGTYTVLSSMIPTLFSTLFTFLVVSVYWLGHHRLFSYIQKVDSRLLQFNLLFLMLISFMPFGLKISGAHSHDITAAVIYPLYMAATGLCLNLIWYHADKNKLLKYENITANEIAYNRIKTLVPPLIFLISAFSAPFNPLLTHRLWLLLIFNNKITDFIFNQFVLKKSKR